MADPRAPRFTDGLENGLDVVLDRPRRRIRRVTVTEQVDGEHTPFPAQPVGVLGEAARMSTV
jgi:hypothetical protein